MSKDISIDTNFSYELPKDDTQNPPEFVPMPISEDENKIRFSPNKNIKSPTNFDFKPFTFDISSHFGLLMIYNETIEQIEVFDIRKNFLYEFEKEECSDIECERQIIWAYKIPKDIFHSLKIIESDEYPLVCINSTDGIQILTIKECTAYQKIIVNNGGNMITKWSRSRPNELINLSTDHTLFTFVLDEYTHSIVSSNVSCFIITTDGEILFINEDEIYLYNKQNHIINTKKIFKNNLIMKNVFEDKALIVSKEEKSENDINYILSLYNYKTNEIKSYSINYELEITEQNICSSIYSSIVIIGLEKESQFLYFNCESVDKFEQIKLNNCNSISIEKDEKDKILTISGIEFINNDLLNLCSCPSIISFFGTYSISMSNIEQISYENIHPTINFVPYDEIKKIKSNYVQVIQIDVSKSIQMTKTVKESSIQAEILKTENRKDMVHFQLNENIVSPSDFNFKEFAFDFSSYFQLLAVYNEKEMKVEILEITKNFFHPYNEDEYYERKPREVIWSYKISNDKFKSFKIIENSEYPFICISSDDGVRIIELKKGKSYVILKVNEGGNLMTKWSVSRPNELVNLSTNHTLYTFNFVDESYKIISSNVSCYIITTDGEISFISEDGIYLYDKQNDIINKKIIFSDNLIMTNVFVDKALIISKKIKEEKTNYILSTYNYKTNEINSFVTEYDLNITEKYICSSIYISIVIIIRPDENRDLIYLHLDKVENKEVLEELNIDDYYQIRNEEDEDTEMPLPRSGIQFIDFRIEPFATFPSIINFFGNNLISLTKIHSDYSDFPYGKDEYYIDVLNYNQIKDLIPDPESEKENETSMRVISIDVSTQRKMKKIEMDLDNVCDEIKIAESDDLIHFVPSENIKSPSNIYFKSSMFDFSSYFGLLAIYNDTEEQVEMFDLRKNIYIGYKEEREEEKKREKEERKRREKEEKERREREEKEERERREKLKALQEEEEEEAKDGEDKKEVKDEPKPEEGNEGEKEKETKSEEEIGKDEKEVKDEKKSEEEEGKDEKEVKDEQKSEEGEEAKKDEKDEEIKNEANDSKDQDEKQEEEDLEEDYDKLNIAWKYKISKSNIKSVKIIENTVYPIVCINSTSGIQTLSLKSGKEIDKLIVNEGGNLITKWSKSRPNEFVNLSSNHTLFTYNFESQTYKIISSNVSCFIITTDSEILFISEDEIYLYNKRKNIINTKKIFKNNMIMKNVFEDKALIVSKEEKSENDINYILSLYNYKTNEIKSYSINYELEITEQNICSSIYSSIVIIGLLKKRKFLFFNCESVDKFEQLNIKDENSIQIPCRKNVIDKPLLIGGIDFINNEIKNICTFPSILNLFGENTICINKIEPLIKTTENQFPYRTIQPKETDVFQFDHVQDIQGFRAPKYSFFPQRNSFGVITSMFNEKNYNYPSIRKKFMPK